MVILDGYHDPKKQSVWTQGGEASGLILALQQLSMQVRDTVYMFTCWAVVGSVVDARRKKYSWKHIVEILEAKA